MPRTKIDLVTLHKLMGHYARQHDEIQRLRIAVGNRVFAMEQDGIEAAHMATVQVQRDALEDAESVIDRQLGRLVKQHPLGKWVETEAKGLSPRSFGLLFGITGPLDRFATVSKLWAYLGMSVVDGRAPRRTKGQKLNYSPQGRTRCFVIGESIVKVGGGGKYRAAYDTKKAEYLARERTGPSGCPMGQEHKGKDGGPILQCVKRAEDGTETSAHLHVAAQRYAVKMLLKDLWIQWRDTVGEGSHVAEVV